MQSSAKAILITSVPGTFYTHKLHSYGHMKIRKILEGINLPDRMKEAPLWCQVIIEFCLNLISSFLVWECWEKIGFMKNF
jgi:hypothetical protein